jgi:hypothetical protein
MDKLMKNPLLLVGLAAAAYFLFFKKSAPAAAPGATSGGAMNAASGGGAAAGVIDAGTKLLTEGIKWGSGVAKENLGSDGGMGPNTLNGMVASVGGLGDLGGSFYGSW